MTVSKPMLRERRETARRVLVVDDHAGFRRCARTLLVAEGFDVVGEAEDGLAAIERAAELEPDVVLLDVQLPDLDGFEVARRLLEVRPLLRIVLVSSRDRTEYGSLVEASGAVGFVAKGELTRDALERLIE